MKAELRAQLVLASTGTKGNAKQTFDGLCQLARKDPDSLLRPLARATQNERAMIFRVFAGLEDKHGLRVLREHGVQDRSAKVRAEVAELLIPFGAPALPLVRKIWRQKDEKDSQSADRIARAALALSPKASDIFVESILLSSLNISCFEKPVVENRGPMATALARVLCRHGAPSEQLTSLRYLFNKTGMYGVLALWDIIERRSGPSVLSAINLLHGFDTPESHHFSMKKLIRLIDDNIDNPDFFKPRGKKKQSFAGRSLHALGCMAIPRYEAQPEPEVVTLAETLGISLLQKILNSQERQSDERTPWKEWGFALSRFFLSCPSTGAIELIRIAMKADLASVRSAVMENVSSVAFQLTESLNRLVGGREWIEANRIPYDDQPLTHASPPESPFNKAVSLGSLVPELCGLVNDEDGEVRLIVLSVLYNLGPFARPVLPALIEHLELRGERQLDDREVGSVLVAIGALGQSTDRVIELMLEALRSPDKEERKTAVGALTSLGDPRPSVGEGLIHALSDKDETVSYLASLAVLKLDPEGLWAKRFSNG